MWIDKGQKTYNKVSRYQIYDYFYNTEDSKYLYGITTRLKNDTAYVSHKVKKGDTWDSLSLFYYHNPTYYWVITDYNRIRDPFVNPKVGSVVKIPSFSGIAFDV